MRTVYYGHINQKFIILLSQERVKLRTSNLERGRTRVVLGPMVDVNRRMVDVNRRKFIISWTSAVAKP